MAYTMVIKVQYRDVLRRFSAKVDENHKLDLDMHGLRAKISSLFGLSAEADLTLTYIDEDGDKVTLVDDGDLCELMNQELDYLKINVVLNSDKGVKFPTMSSGGCPHLRSPQGLSRLPDTKSGYITGVAELLKFAVLVSEGLAKFAIDCFRGHASSGSLFAEHVGFASETAKNLGSSPQTQDSGASERSKSSKDESRPEELLKETTVKGPNASKNDNMPEEVLKNATSKGSKAENLLEELVKCATSKVDEIRPAELLKNATSKGSNASKDENMPEEPLKSATSQVEERRPELPKIANSKGSIASKDGSRQNLVLPLPKCATSKASCASKNESWVDHLFKSHTSKASDASRRDDLLKSPTSSESSSSEDESLLEKLGEGATSNVPNASKGKGRAEEFLKDSTSKGSKASKYGSRHKLPIPKSAKLEDATFGGELGKTVTPATPAPVRVNYKAGGSRPTPRALPKRFLPVGSTSVASPPTRPPLFQNPPPVVSASGAPTLPFPPPRAAQAHNFNNNPFVDSSSSSFIPPNKSASVGNAFGAATNPAFSRSSSVPAYASPFSSSSSFPSHPALSSSSSTPAYASPSPPAFQSHFLPNPFCVPPYFSTFPVAPKYHYHGAPFAFHGASSDHNIPPSGQ